MMSDFFKGFSRNAKSDAPAQARPFIRSPFENRGDAENQPAQARDQRPKYDQGAPAQEGFRPGRPPLGGFDHGAPSEPVMDEYDQDGFASERPEQRQNARQPQARRTQRPRLDGLEKESLGGFHEALRLKCENVVFKFSELNATMSAVDDLFRDFAKISESLQEQTSANLELERENARLRAQQDELQGRVGALEDERGETEQKLRSAETMADNHRTEMRRATELIAQLEVRAEEATAEINGLRRELITLQPLHADLNEQTIRLRQRMDEVTHELAAARAGSDALELRLIAESESLESERKALHELNGRYLDARQQLSQSEQSQARLRINVEQLQAEVAQLKESDRILRLAAEEERTRRETEGSAYESKLFAMRSRSELVERLLEKAREELRALVDASRRVEQLTARLNQSEESLASARNELVKTKDEVMSLQASRDALSLRVDEFARKLTEQEAENQRIIAEKLDQKRDMEFAIAAHQKDEKKLQAQIRSLEDQLLKEKSERAYAEGALDTARRDRLQLQRLANDLKREEMFSVVARDEPAADEPTALRRP
jgi:crescentin